ncbi:MAG: hypothetical protein MI861_19410 [Pirellulales bacterium]|nr:hypothetical protein [Pirellulales bacterium]
MKISPQTAPHRHTPSPAQQEAKPRHQRRLRPWITLLFAIVLAIIAGITSAEQTPGVVEFRTDHQVSPPAAHPEAEIDPNRVGGGAIPPILTHARRPAYVELSAQLANFDADADPDGWRAQVILRDRLDRPAPMRATARFELRPRMVSTVTGRQFEDAAVRPIGWSVPLNFDEQGVAQLKLPLRDSLKPALGWPRSLNSRWAQRRSRPAISRPDSRDRWNGAAAHLTDDLRQALGPAVWGQLTVRVSVPTEGVFESVVPVRVRPPVLVDTSWPYR